MGRTQAGFFVDIIYRTLHNVQTATLTGSSAAKSNITDAAKLSWASVMAAIFNAKIRPRQQALAVLTSVSRHLEQKPGATLGLVNPSSLMLRGVLGCRRVKPARSRVY